MKRDSTNWRNKLNKPRCSYRLEENKDKIILSYQDGMSLENLALAYGVNYSTMRRFLLAQSVTLRPAVTPRKLQRNAEAIEKAYRLGESTLLIAERYNVDRNTVSAFLKALGIRRATPLGERTFFIENEGDKGMLAGLILGEGTIMATDKRVAVRVVNTDSDIINWCAKFGGRTYWQDALRPQSRKLCGVWDLAATVDVFHCLISVLPYLVGRKRLLAENALMFLEDRYGLSA
jgi:hypothetical protein